ALSPDESDRHRSGLDLDAAVSEDDLDLFPPSQAELVPERLGDYHSACLVDGSSHGITIQSRGGLFRVIAHAGVSVFNDITNAFWFVLLIKAAVVLVFFLVAPLGMGYMEHKVLAHMQARLGPMYAGRFHGWAQLIADGVKFVQKEDVIPTAADRVVFTLAPAVAMIPYILLFAVIPFDDNLFAQNLDCA